MHSHFPISKTIFSKNSILSLIFPGKCLILNRICESSRILRMVYDLRTSFSSHLVYRLDTRGSLPFLSSSKNNKVVGESVAHGFENTGAPVASLSFCRAPYARWISSDSCQNQAPFPRTHFCGGLCDAGADSKETAMHRLATDLIEALKIQRTNCIKLLRRY